MTKDEELQDAYNKLDAAERQITRMKKREIDEYKVQQVLIAAGFLTQEKLNEARDILEGVPEGN
jgi:hypothetical protein